VETLGLRATSVHRAGGCRLAAGHCGQHWLLARPSSAQVSSFVKRPSLDARPCRAYRLVKTRRMSGLNFKGAEADGPEPGFPSNPTELELGRFSRCCWQQSAAVGAGRSRRRWRGRPRAGQDVRQSRRLNTMVGQEVPHAQETGKTRKPVRFADQEEEVGQTSARGRAWTACLTGPTSRHSAETVST